MIDIDTLEDIMSSRNVSRGELAEALCISKNELEQKLRLGRFDSDEMQIIVDYLELDTPSSIFFA